MFLYNTNGFTQYDGNYDLYAVPVNEGDEFYVEYNGNTPNESFDLIVFVNDLSTI